MLKGTSNTKLFRTKQLIIRMARCKPRCKKMGKWVSINNSSNIKSLILLKINNPISKNKLVNTHCLNFAVILLFLKVLKVHKDWGDHLSSSNCPKKSTKKTVLQTKTWCLNNIISNNSKSSKLKRNKIKIQVMKRTMWWVNFTSSTSNKVSVNAVAKFASPWCTPY